MKVKLSLASVDFTLSIEKDDMKEAEDLLARVLTRGLVSATRMLAKEGLLSSFKLSEAQPTPEVPKAAVPEPPPPPPPPESMPDLSPLPLVAKPTASFLPPTQVAKPFPAVTKLHERKHRSVKMVCKTVADRPHGYIDRKSAETLLGGESSGPTLSTWIIERQVEAVIVANEKPPTKGLPGRLYVNKQSLIERNAQRLQHPRYMAR